MELLKELTTIVRCVLRALCSPPQERAVARIVLWVRTWTKRGKHTVLIVPQTRTIMKIKKLPVKPELVGFFCGRRGLQTVARNLL